MTDKGEYDFETRVGTFTGDENGGDLVVFNPIEGSVYAYGQKDHRGNNTTKSFKKWKRGKFVVCDKIGC